MWCWLRAFLRRVWGRQRREVSADGTAIAFISSANNLVPTDTNHTAWLAERALCSWLALAARLRGGVRYRGRRVRTAATPTRRIRRRLLAETGPGP